MYSVWNVFAKTNFSCFMMLWEEGVPCDSATTLFMTVSNGHDIRLSSSRLVQKNVLCANVFCEDELLSFHEFGLFNRS